MKGLLDLELMKAIQGDRNGKAARRAAMAVRDDLVIRRAQASDAKRIERLAQLDSGEVPAGPALVAEVDGMLVAALPLDRDGRALADPFMPTAPLVELLRIRRAQLRSFV